MNGKITVSVIVPVFGVEKYLHRCVESLINQTYAELEIILVDDGSPDKCPEICDQYAMKYDNIISLHKDNGGLSSARNYGVNHSHNNWVVFVDSDDYVEPTYVETLVKLKKKYNADLVITRIERVQEVECFKQRKNQFRPYILEKKEAIFKVYSGIDVGWSAVAKLIPKHLMQKYPFPDGYYEDCACMYKIIWNSNRVVIGDYRNNYHYIQRGGSILSSQLSDKHYHILEIDKEFMNFLFENYSSSDLLKTLFHKRVVVQLLNMQRMTNGEYREIFSLYRNEFRSNLLRVLRDKRISHEIKMYVLLLSSTPSFYYLIQHCYAIIKRLKATF